MTFYIVLWVFFCVLGLQSYISKKTPSKYFYLFVVFILAVIVAIRDNVGADWQTYYDFYYTGYASDKMSGVYEPIFMLIRHICYYLGFNHVLFFFILAFFSLSILYIVTNKLKIENVYISFFIYFSIVFVSYQFNTVRNGVMASLIWLSFVYKMEGKNFKAIIIVLIASGFHVVALAFLPLLFLLTCKISRKIACVFILVGLLAVFLQIGERLIEMFPFLKTIDRLSGYVDTTYNDSYGISVGTIFNIILLLYMKFACNRSYLKHIEMRVVLNTMLYAIMIVCVFNAFPAIVSRVGQVLNLSLMFVWPYLITHSKAPLIKASILSILSIYLWLYYSKGLEATLLWSDKLAYIPYEWSFNGILR